VRLHCSIKVVIYATLPVVTVYLSLHLLVHLSHCVEMFGEICLSLQLFLAFCYVTLVRGNETFKSFLICFLCASAILFIKVLIV